VIPGGYQFNDCRGMLRHSWHETDSTWFEGSDGTPFTIRCERCDTERRDVLGTNTGDLVSRHYIYPTGYRIDPAARPKIVDFRLAWLDDQIASMKARRSNK